MVVVVVVVMMMLVLVLVLVVVDVPWTNTAINRTTLCSARRLPTINLVHSATHGWTRFAFRQPDLLHLCILVRFLS